MSAACFDSPSRSRASTTSLSLPGAAAASRSSCVSRPRQTTTTFPTFVGNPPRIEGAGLSSAPPPPPPHPATWSFGIVAAGVFDRPKSLLLHSPNSFESPRESENHSPKRHCGDHAGPSRSNYTQHTRVHIHKYTKNRSESSKARPISALAMQAFFRRPTPFRSRLLLFVRSNALRGRGASG